jgi:hypothetical protein
VWIQFPSPAFFPNPKLLERIVFSILFPEKAFFKIEDFQTISSRILWFAGVPFWVMENTEGQTPGNWKTVQT